MFSPKILCLLAVVGCAVACAPPPKPAAPAAASTEATSSQSPKRRKRSISEDVIVILETGLRYDAAKNEQYLNLIREKISALAKSEGIQTNATTQRQALQIRGRFASKVTISGASGDCAEVKKFVNVAVHKIDELTNAIVACGSEHPVHISRV